MDLKEEDETWEDAFNKLKMAASVKEPNILSSIQCFYECERAAQENKDDNGPTGIIDFIETGEDELEPGQTEDSV
jgi:hypothetical protein